MEVDSVGIRAGAVMQHWREDKADEHTANDPGGKATAPASPIRRKCRHPLAGSDVMDSDWAVEAEATVTVVTAEILATRGVVGTKMKFGDVIFPPESTSK